MWPQDNAWGTVTQSQAIAQAVPGGRRNIPTALQLIQTRPVLATQAYTFKSSVSRTRSGPATSPPSTDSGGLAKPRSLARWYRGGETNALNGDPGATGALALKTLCLPALRPHGWRSSGRCWSTLATSQHTLPSQRQSTSQNTAGPIFSWSRLAQISKTPGLLLPVMPASGALRRVRWLNRSPCEGRRRQGTL